MCAPITSLQQQSGRRSSTRSAWKRRWSEAELEPWADPKLLFNLNFLDRLGDRHLDWPAMLRQVQCPVLLITGDPEAGALVSRQAALLLEEHLPKLRVADITGAGRSIRRDQGETYLRVVQPFFAGMGARTGAAARERTTRPGNPS